MAEKVEDVWLLVSDISEKIGVPVETVRRYIRNHGVHLRVKKIHKKYEVHSESLDVFKQIRELYADGKNIQEVEQTLSNRGVPMTINVNVDDDESVTVSVADELQRMNEKLTQQEEFNKLLVEKLDQQQAEFKQELKQLERQLENKIEQSKVEELRIMREERVAMIETSATQEQQQKKGFFKRLFGK
jgi:DNA-binding transcriptional MerR regulator